MKTSICECGSNEFSVQLKPCRVTVGNNDAVLVAVVPARICAKCGRAVIEIQGVILEPPKPAVHQDAPEAAQEPPSLADIVSYAPESVPAPEPVPEAPVEQEK